jgi:NADPH:quinone reductase-like Zn-dependent oxidoreductase
VEHEALILLDALIEEGVIELVIDRYCPLAQVAEAHRYFQEGQRVGNVGIIVDHN